MYDSMYVLSYFKLLTNFKITQKILTSFIVNQTFLVVVKLETSNIVRFTSLSKLNCRRGFKSASSCDSLWYSLWMPYGRLD